jgi:hypothetical protein
MLAMVCQVDRMGIAGKNPNTEDDIPGAVRLIVDFLVVICLPLAAREVFFSALGR